MQMIWAHGWAYDAGTWEKLLPYFPDQEHVLLERGYFGATPQALPDILEENCVFVAHSFGCMWLLRHAPRAPKALITFAGFDCFHAHIAARVLKSMQLQLRRNAEAQLQRFRVSCGDDRALDASQLDLESLSADLKALAEWDERECFANWDIPKHCIAAENDQITPPAMLREIWGEQLSWHPQGHHALPLLEPEFCAREIQELLHAL